MINELVLHETVSSILIRNAGTCGLVPNVSPAFKVIATYLIPHD